MFEDDDLVTERKLSREEWSRQIKQKKQRAIMILSSIAAALIIVLTVLSVVIVRSIKNKTASAENEVLIPYEDAVNKGIVTGSADDSAGSKDTPVPVSFEDADKTELTDNETDKAPVPDKGTVIIDAGHGGKDPGAIGLISKESDINLLIAEQTKAELESLGYTVIMTRTDDSFVGLTERVNIANAYPNSLCFVSIHQNSVDNAPNVTGTEVLTCNNRNGNWALAETLANDVSEQISSRNRGVQNYTNLVVIRDTVMPAALVECGFISSDHEEELLFTDEYRSLIAIGIAKGIDEFCDTYYQDH